jgi:hypothetical protein
MALIQIDKKKLIDTVQQLKVLYSSHEKNLEQVKYNLPFKMGLKSEMKTIKKLLKYYNSILD